VTAVLGFVLGTAAAMALAGVVLSLAVLLAWPAVARLAASRRADAAFALLLLPALGALGVGVAIATPSMGHALGVWADHCLHHSHHAHLCWLHGGNLPPAVAVVGAAALAVFALRAGRVGYGIVRVSRTAAALARLGRADAERRIWVPGAPRLCHVVGVLRPRVLVSDALREALPAGTLDVVLAHEQAHLERRDPVVGAVASLAAAFGLPSVSGRLVTAWRQAAEEAADADAAARHGVLPVADALVAFARLDIRPVAVGAGFGSTGLEARVVHLLGERTVARPSRAGVFALALAFLMVAGALSHHEALHHSVEELVTVVGTVAPPYYPR
jgi:Zn-dependent protease with chaperone function